MAGFIRRYGYFPGTEIITQIEGVVVVDLPPPGGIQGVGVGVACLVGEFADCTYATVVNSSGVVSTKIRPVEVFSATDLINKVGGFDETLGAFGTSMGNGFEALRSKKFSRLILAPINLASSNGCRYFRELPVCTTATNANPVVPVTGGTLIAGREFRAAGSALSRIKVAARVTFTALTPIATGIAGTTTNAAAAATQNFSATAGFDWTTIVRPDGTLGAHKGDILVIGHNNAGAFKPLPSGGNLGAGTYRVASDPASGVVIALERLDGANFAFVTDTAIPWRLHFASDADSAPVLVPGNATPGGYAASEAGGYTIPTRPLTNSAGAQTDGTYAAATVLAPAVTPTAATGSSWDPLSGLGGRIMPGGSGGLTYTTLVQGVNAAAGSSLDAAYATAFDALLSEDQGVRDVNIVWAARKSSTIRAKIKSHVLEASTRGTGRMGINAPDLSVQTMLAAIADSDPGIGAYRDERVIYTWPGCRLFVPEAVNYRLRCADSTTTIDGILDQSFDGFVAAVLSNLAPERNPGQAAPPIPGVLAPVLGIQRGVDTLGMAEYTQLRSSGVMALRMDRTAGPIIQSGITSSLTAGQKNVNRRRMADFIEDSAAQRLVQFAKLPQTQSLKDAAVGELDAFLNSLLSPNNPAAQRIAAYQIDDVSGNTPELEANGIFVIIIRVRTLATADFIVLQAEIGERVQILPLAA